MQRVCNIMDADYNISLPYTLIFISQNQKEFGFIGAAVLLILSPKELI